MPAPRETIDLPPNPTPEQLALKRYIETTPGLTVNGWATKAGVAEGTLRKFLSTTGATMTLRTWQKLAAAERKTVQELLENPLAAKVVLVGYIGGGAVIHLFDGDSAQGMNELIDRPPGITGEGPIEALEVRGDSMYPIADGWRIFYRRGGEIPASDAIGQICVVKLRNGDLLLKKVKSGNLPGRYNLESWNAPTMENQEVAAVIPVDAFTQG